MRRVAPAAALLAGLLSLAACSSPPGAAAPSTGATTPTATAAAGSTSTGAAKATAAPSSKASSPAAGAPSSAPPSSSSAAGAASTSPAAGTITKLLVIVEENHSLSQALSGMPYLAGQAARYGLATGYSAVAHPSLPNYLAIAGGSTFGVTDDAYPSAHQISGASVFGQVLAAGGTAKTYAESMPLNCAQASAGQYAVKHNPWAYFVSEREACQRYDVSSGSPSSGALHSDVAAGKLPTFGMLIPNICNDAHNCSLGTADNWLKGWLPQIEAGPDFTSGRLAVVVTFDEAEGGSSNGVLTVVLARALHGVKVNAALSHYSITRAGDSLVGAAPLRQAAHATNLLTAFGLS